jgi:hypothetical protein
MKKLPLAISLLFVLTLLAARCNAQDLDIRDHGNRFEVQSHGSMKSVQLPLVILRAKAGNAKTFLPTQFDMTQAPKLSTFEFSYSPSTPEEAKTAFEFAAAIWAAYIDSSQVIRVEVSWEEMDDPRVLGGARPTYSIQNFSNRPESNVFYPVALANKFAGVDLLPDDSDIYCVFNSTNNDLYFGTDGRPPANKYDFVSVVLHELGHGLGFTSSAGINDAALGHWGSGSGPWPNQFDQFVETESGDRIIDTTLFSNPSIELAQIFTGNALFYNDVTIGYRYPLYAPNPWSEGSSISHLDEATFPEGNPNSLMTPGIYAQEAIHDPGPLTLNILKNCGWHEIETPIFEANTKLGLVEVYGIANVCHKITLQGHWTAEIIGSNLVVTSSAGTSTWNASNPAWYYFGDADGYVAFYCGSNALSSLEYVNFDPQPVRDLAYVAENMLRGVPYQQLLLVDDEPINIADRFALLSHGRPIAGSKTLPLTAGKAATRRMNCKESGMNSRSGQVVFTTPDESLEITCKKINGKGGDVEIKFMLPGDAARTTIMKVYGDPHIKVPLQKADDNLVAMFQQPDKSVVFVCPDGRTAVQINIHDVYNKDHRLIESVTVLDTVGPHWVHIVSGLYGNAVVNHDRLKTAAGQEQPSNVYYPDLLHGTRRLAMLSTSGKLLAFDTLQDGVEDFEKVLINRCFLRGFDDGFENYIYGLYPELDGDAALRKYFIEIPGTKDAVFEEWMQAHVNALIMRSDP